MASLYADVFMPDFGMGGNVVREHLDAIFGVQVDDVSAILLQPIDAAVKIYGLADNYCPDAELADQATAIPAGRERGNHDFVAVSALAARLSKGVRLSMYGRIAFLHSAVVAAPEQFSITFEQRSADGNSSFSKAEARFFQSHFQHGEVLFPIFF
jgi:biotin carboxylase